MWMRGECIVNMLFGSVAGVQFWKISLWLDRDSFVAFAFLFLWRHFEKYFFFFPPMNDDTVSFRTLRASYNGFTLINQIKWHYICTCCSFKCLLANLSKMCLLRHSGENRLKMSHFAKGMTHLKLNIHVRCNAWAIASVVVLSDCQYLTFRISLICTF